MTLEIRKEVTEIFTKTGQTEIYCSECGQILYENSGGKLYCPNRYCSITKKYELDGREVLSQVEVLK